MKYLIYGSTAIKHFFPDYEKEPRDLDIITETDNKYHLDIEECKVIEQYYLPEFQYIFDNNKDDLYVDPVFLYTIKMSHLSWDINFDKHMKSAIFLKSKGCKLDKVLYDSLMKAWERVHYKKKVKMNVKNSEFFKENIERAFDHEFLHEQFAFYDRPLNERIRKDLDSPLCSEELWNLLTTDDKLKCALEELMVLTAERYVLVPEENKLPIKFARIKMLKQMITSTTSGWFNLYLKENFKMFIDNEFPEFFYNKIKELETIRIDTRLDKFFTDIENIKDNKCKLM